MTDATEAARLAARLFCHAGKMPHTPEWVPEAEALLLQGASALRALAARPTAPAEVREVVARAVDPWFVTNGPQSVRRVIDVGYTAFMAAKHPNAEDGGPSDWFTDTYPMLTDVVTDMRTAIIDEVCAALARFAPAAARPAVGETWETDAGPVMVVPVEPTEAMKDAGETTISDGSGYLLDEFDVDRVYRAMLAAIKEPKP